MSVKSAEKLYEQLSKEGWVLNTVQRAEQLAYERDISLLQLTKISKINYSTITSARRRNSQLSVDTIERICGALSISLAEFFTEPTEAKK